MPVMSNQNRNPGGTPTGGQFAAGRHAEAEVSLGFSAGPVLDPDADPRRPENICSWTRLNLPSGELIEDLNLTRVRPGDKVAFRNGSIYRKGVVVAVDGYIRVLFATEASRGLAERELAHREQTWADREGIRRHAGIRASREWAAAEQAADPDSDHYRMLAINRTGWDPSDIPEQVAEAEAALGAMGTRDEYIARVQQESAERLEARHEEAKEGADRFVVTQETIVTPGDGSLLLSDQ